MIFLSLKSPEFKFLFPIYSRHSGELLYGSTIGPLNIKGEVRRIFFIGSKFLSDLN